MLSHVRRTLPSGWYYEAAHHHRELERIWWNRWLCVAHQSEWPATGSYRLAHIGDQQILITRAASGELHAFHNTCRHRGSLLCETASGQFRQQRIVCPFHAWTYSLEGELTGTPRKPETGDFRPESYPLYRVGLQTWAGGEVDIPALIAFGNQVVTEDARVCELNQKGLHSRRHEHGILAPQEYDVLAFDNWVLTQLGEPVQE